MGKFKKNLFQNILGTLILWIFFGLVIHAFAQEAATEKPSETPTPLVTAPAPATTTTTTTTTTIPAPVVMAPVSTPTTIPMAPVTETVTTQAVESKTDEAEKIKPVELNAAIGILRTEKLDFDFDTRIQVGSESLLEVKAVPQKRELIFNGLKPGQTSVTVRDKSGNIMKEFLVKVTSDDQSKLVQQLKELLQGVEGLEIGIKGGKVVLDGKLYVPSDIGRIGAVLQQYGENVLSLVQLAPETKEIISKKMQDEIHNNNMKDVNVRVVNGVFWLEGVVNSEVEKTLAERLVAGYVPDRIEPLALQTSSQFKLLDRKDYVNFLIVNEKKDPQPPPKLLRITSQFVELAKDYGKVFGFSWMPTLGGDGGSISIRRSADGVSTSSSNTLSGVISNLFPKLHSARQAGYARVIQTGMVVVKDGEEGKVSKSGETAYPVGTGEGQTATSVKTGFDLAVKPTVLENENVQMNVALNVSINTGQTADGRPIVTENQVTTIVVTKSKESAVIGGVVLKEVTTSYDKDPNKQIDSTSGSYLMTFKRSKLYKQNKSQYVVFLTADIIDSASKGSEEVKKKFRFRGQ